MTNFGHTLGEHGKDNSTLSIAWLYVCPHGMVNRLNKFGKSSFPKPAIFYSKNDPANRPTHWRKKEYYWKMMKENSKPIFIECLWITILVRTNQFYIIKDTKAIPNLSQALLSNISEYRRGFKNLLITNIKIVWIIWRRVILFNPMLETTLQIKKFWVSPRVGWICHRMRQQLNMLGP